MITEEALERQASIRIAIIDDDENSREQIKTITEKTLSEQNQNCFVKTYGFRKWSVLWCFFGGCRDAKNDRT